MGEGLSFYAVVQRMQVGGGDGGDGEHDLRVAAVADDPGGLDYWILAWTDFPAGINAE